MSTHHISSVHLSISNLGAMLRENKTLALSDESRNAIAKCRAYLEERLSDSDELLYGINTGFGALCDIRIEKESLQQLQDNLVRSHACGVGKPVPRDIAKLMLLLKIQSLSYGYSGIQVSTVERLIEFFNKGLIPIVFEKGSLGASGDLAPLAHLSLPLIGEGSFYGENGESIPAKDALTKHDLKPLQLGPKEGLALLNGTQFMSASKDYKKITSAITEKGLRYDLTVPLARYVAMNRNGLVFPFKRYQIDKVWRADRPQKGRYREFYQCNADVIGSYSLIYDAECILMFDEVLTALKLPDFVIKINNRKILSGMAEAWGFADKFGAFAIAIDKIDKIGENGVVQELGSKGFTETQIHRFQNLLRLKGSTEEKLSTLEGWLTESETGKKGIAELKEVLEYVSISSLKKAEIRLDLGLARGLDYYTSTIFEVVLKTVQMGSIASGGRYDELTASFGVPDMPGVGISFGAERIFDVLRDLNLLPANAKTQVKVLLANFGKEEEKYAFKVLGRLRENGIASEIYPNAAKLPKQFTYAEKKGIPYLLLLGSNEIASDTYPMKNLGTGEQKTLSWQELLGVLKTE